jgi:hypothetical protein
MKDDHEPIHAAGPPDVANYGFSRKRWTTPRVILSEMADVGSPYNPGVLSVDVKGTGTASGDGS